ncbi:hypothetical protein [Caldisalinibacter kiritimatiensis]|uniref:DUF5668 domain-containing protein n=1 Tax=Caldisalinibacter kiritimatiensis TaxID=1304284 RepID=R1ASD3_9FIRM|nr:hypothetical protein [Caldisalinibacter kiritimatiensis]EOD00043.1 hypothetical protein L21TH_1932 [Caldisalinibacter kiritimatiensis]
MPGKNDKVLGLILILIGIGVLLLNTNLLPKGVVLAAVGVAFLIGYSNKKITGYLVSGLILIALGIGSIANEFSFTTTDLSGPLFLWALGMAFLVIYFVKNIKGFIYPGCILPAIGTFVLIQDMYDSDLLWVFFLLIALSFFVVYLLEFRKQNVSWPLIPASVLAVISVIFFLISENIISNDFWRIVSYIWPLLLVIAGVRIIYNSRR